MKAKTSFILDFSKKQVSENFPLYFGYKKHYGGFIKKDANGRFHIVNNGYRSYSIHYDVNTVEGRHMTLPSEYILPKEFKKLYGFIKKLKKLYSYKNIKNQGTFSTCKMCLDYIEIYHKGRCKNCHDKYTKEEILKYKLKKKLRLQTELYAK